MQAHRLIYMFFFSFFMILFLAYGLVTTADPYRVFNKSWALNQDFHLNFYLKKMQLLDEIKNVELIILGSSTSENYLVQDIELQTGLKTFHASVAGSKPAGRMALANRALEDVKTLKKIIYITDFYEFNFKQQDYFDPLVYDNSRLNHYVPQVAKKRPFQLEEKIWQIYSHVTLEKAINQFSYYLRGRSPVIYSKNGGKVESVSNPTTIVNSTFLQKMKEEVESAPSIPVKKLSEKIDESLIEYKTGALADFEYSDLSEAMFRELSEKTQKKDVQLLIILSPHHPRFKTAIFQDQDMAEGYKLWRRFFDKLDQLEGVTVLDRLDDIHDFLPPAIPHWRDGVHYSPAGSAILLHKLLKKASR